MGVKTEDGEKWGGGGAQETLFKAASGGVYRKVYTGEARYRDILKGKYRCR